MNWKERKKQLAKWKVRWAPQTRDQQLIVLVMFFTVIPLVVIPMGAIIYYSFVSEFPTTEETSYTTEHYEELFLHDTELFIDITINQLIFSVGSVGLALIIGIAAVILFEKYVESFKLRTLMLLPYALPSIASATGWIVLLGNAGIINEFFVNSFNLSEAPINIYSLKGMIFAEAVHSAPLVFLLLSPAMKSISAELEEASYTSGASRFKTYKDIIFPLMMPSLISITIFLFARSLALVSVPAVLGLPASIFTYGTALPFIFMGGQSINYSLAIVFSVYLIIISALLMVIYYQYTSKEDKYTTVGGQSSGGSKRYNTGRLQKYLGKSAVIIYIFIGGFLPFLAILWDSLSPGLGVSYNISQITLENYITLFQGESPAVPHWWRAFRNTIMLGIFTPTISIIIAFLISYSNKSLKVRGSGLIAYIASVPLAVPSVTLGLAFLVVFIRTPLYGTFGILLVAFIGKAVPTAMRYSSPALLRIGKENVEASTISGYGELLTFRKTISKLVASDVVAGWMHIFVFVVRDVALAIILYSFGSELISIEILFAIENANRSDASTMGVILTLLGVVPYMYLQYWRREQLTEAVEVQ